LFTKDDVTKADKFAQALSKARFDMSVTEWIQFHQQLIWYNQLIKKIQDHVFEPVKVTDEQPSAKNSKKSKSS
jgi:hypothetical protein